MHPWGRKRHIEQQRTEYQYADRTGTWTGWSRTPQDCGSRFPKAKRARRSSTRARHAGRHRGGLGDGRNLPRRPRHIRLAPTGINPKWPFELCVRIDRSGDRLPRQPICWLGALAWRRQIGVFSRLARVPAARWRARSPYSRNLAYRDHGFGRATLVLECDRRAAARNHREGRATIAAFSPKTSLSSSRRRKVSPAACRSSRGCSKSRCTKRMN